MIAVHEGNLVFRSMETVSQRRNSATNWYCFDALGSTWNLTNASETITDSYIYDAWGNQLTSTETTTNPFLYVGQFGYYYDAETNNNYIRARVYQPTIARWWSADPLGFVDGLNMYLYVKNRTINGVDPSGLGWKGLGTKRHQKAKDKLLKMLLAICNKCPDKPEPPCPGSKKKCTKSQCITDAKMIAGGFFWTLERNWVARWNWGSDERYRGYWCFDWSAGFKKMVEIASENKCFKATRGYSVPNPNPSSRIHEWVRIESSCSPKDYVYLDDHFGDSKNFVHTEPPNPDGWAGGTDNKPNAKARPVTPYFGPASLTYNKCMQQCLAPKNVLTATARKIARCKQKCAKFKSK